MFYRLSLAEYLGSTIVLDDQLVQSADNRTEWFRTLLTEKARSLQILVFTCRPGDYLAKSAMVPKDALSTQIRVAGPSARWILAARFGEGS